MISFYLYTLTPPRPTFLDDMTPTEAAVMEQHFACWQRLLDIGTAVVYGPVVDPAGTYGIAVVEAETIGAVELIAGADPAVEAGIGTHAVFAMPGAITRQAAGPLN